MAVMTIHLVTSSLAMTDDNISTIKRMLRTRLMNMVYDYF